MQGVSKSILILSLTVGSFCIAAPEFAAAETLYKIQGARGSVTFTTRVPPPGSKYTVIAPRSTSYSTVYTSRRMNFRAMASKYDKLIEDTAQQHGLEPALVKAVIHAESAFNPLARSHKGARGLMQLMPATASRMGVGDSYHPEQNVQGGVKYLKWLLDRYNGNLRHAVAAYNAGEGAVDKMKGVPPYSETIQYVQRVTTLLNLYRSKDDSGKRLN